MSSEAEPEGRPRPLSAGLWTLFSWLRRDDRSVSTDSLSSAGSDRTVASFAFLTPALYPTTGPVVLPPQGPPTDSYRKRLHDRNLRRHHDRDLTLHRKYGLHKSEGIAGYDAFSLPPARRANGEFNSKWDRDRRATSECYQRRLAHVPGKRRAPLPPGSSATNSLTRRTTRKRPAPQPPVSLLEKNKENTIEIEVKTANTQMTSKSSHDKPKLRNSEITMGCKSEKYSKTETSTKDTKIKSERSFLKQIFDSKKRNSAIDTSSVKVLPSISELDKQAAAIIETCKLKAAEQNNNDRIENSNHTDCWICTGCLKKYKPSVAKCEYCIIKQKNQTPGMLMGGRMEVPKASSSYTQTEKDVHIASSTKTNNSEERQKLKEMLKEMKDSLPKRAKHDVNNAKGTKTVITVENFGRTSYSTETPTLRVGSTITDTNKLQSDAQTSTSKNKFACSPGPVPTGVESKPHAPSEQAILVAQVISAYKNNLDNNLKLLKENKQTTETEKSQKVIAVQVVTANNEQKTHKPDTTILHTPLKISSLLNPMYIPKKRVINESQPVSKKDENQDTGESSTDKSISTTVSKCVPIPSTSAGISPSRISEISLNIGRPDNDPKTNIGIAKGYVPSQNHQPVISKEGKRIIESKPKETEFKLTSASKEQNAPRDVDSQNQHLRRRALINQLEKSIAKGDERAAAEAAVKLAQLRLSCSVLSFSSQILCQPSTSRINDVKNVETEKGNQSTKHNESQQNVLKENTVVPSSVTPKLELISKVTTTAAVVPVKVTQSSESKLQLEEPVPLPRKKDATGQQNIIKIPSEGPSTSNDNGIITIAVLVEDREATRGPVHLRISRQAIMRDLRREAETSLGVATNLQRWIVGRALCVDDRAPVASLAGPHFTAPFYLCVVESDMKETLSPVTNKASTTKTTNEDKTQNAGDVYTELMQLEQQALVPNSERFECGVCMEEYPAGQGAVLRECVHTFCKECLSDVVRHCEEPDIACPAMGCRGMLQEREIRALVSPQDYERWLARGLAAAESGTRNAFHCRTRDCKGWALCEPGVQRFPCPVCKRNNCVPCQAIHDGETCEQFQVKIKQAAVSANTNDTDDGTRTLLNSLISKGEALECPECSAIITKKWGCDWVKCSACKTEICWVTRGRRWGPAGKGDTSAGCRCGLDGKRCHPSCGYCH